MCLISGTKCELFTIKKGGDIDYFVVVEYAGVIDYAFLLIIVISEITDMNL